MSLRRRMAGARQDRRWRCEGLGSAWSARGSEARRGAPAVVIHPLRDEISCSPLRARPLRAARLARPSRRVLDGAEHLVNVLSEGQSAIIPGATVVASWMGAEEVAEEVVSARALVAPVRKVHRRNHGGPPLPLLERRVEEPAHGSFDIRIVLQAPPECGVNRRLPRAEQLVAARVWLVVDHDRWPAVLLPKMFQEDELELRRTATEQGGTS